LVAAWSATSEFLATGSADGTVIVWRFELLEKRICVVHHSATILRPSGDSPSVPSDITALAWSADNVLAVGTYSGTLCLYRDGAEVARHASFTAPIVVLDYSPSGAFLLVGALNGAVRFLTRSDSVNLKLNGELTSGACLDENRAAVSCANVVYSLCVGKKPVKVVAAHGDITQLAVQQKTGLFAACDLAGTVYVFDKTGATVHTLHLHRSAVCALSFAQMPTVYATGGVDGIVRVVNAAEGGQPAVLEGGHALPVLAASFDPIGRYVASADVDIVNI
jgi:WD40 repeat protein